MQVLKKKVQSPLNYMGGKFKLLPQILPLFPHINGTFIDLFCGGGNVGLNVDCHRVILNDINAEICGLYSMFQSIDKVNLFEIIEEIIDKYRLSRSNIYGYSYYNCESSKGLGNYNREKFLNLREDFNKRKCHDHYYYAMLYVLIVYAFNNQTRFNGAGNFNLPVGKRDFNDKMRLKLSAFIDRIKRDNCVFLCGDFREIKVESIGKEDFIYADPPYLITCATYNEKKGWDNLREMALCEYLDRADSRGVRFALSNVLRSGGKTNELLCSWLSSRKYKVVHLNYGYSNSNYHKKERHASSDEVLIMNY